VPAASEDDRAEGIISYQLVKSTQALLIGSRKELMPL
jgi:hypothetical protein